MNGGVEAQKGFFETRDYANKLGVADTLQTDDRLNNWQYMAFLQADWRLPGGWTLTGGASFNVTDVTITRLSVRPVVTNNIRFDNKIAPRIAALKKITADISLYASASRGFSTPTVQELEKSNGIVGPPLQPEDGIDYETGIRGSFLQGRLFFDVDGFFFHLKNTIVQRIDSSGVMYSINAGGTDQHGLETYVSWLAVSSPDGIFRTVKLWISHAWHDFHYRNFTQDTSNFSGHRLPGVPQQTVVAGLDIALVSGFYTNITYTYTDRIALNDAKTAFAGSYDLLGGRIGWRRVLGKWRLDFLGVSTMPSILNTAWGMISMPRRAGITMRRRVSIILRE